MGRETITDEEYWESGMWKCTYAPVNKDIQFQAQFNTGAHHWIGLGIYLEDYQLYHCKYCEELRMKPISFKTALCYSREKAKRLLKKFNNGKGLSEPSDKGRDVIPMVINSQQLGESEESWIGNLRN